MANNRMYLMNVRTGEFLYVAKYYPETGWYCIGNDEYADKLNAFFDKNKADPTMFGDEDYVIVYEMDESKRRVMRAVAEALKPKENP